TIQDSSFNAWLQLNQPGSLVQLQSTKAGANSGLIAISDSTNGNVISAIYASDGTNEPYFLADAIARKATIQSDSILLVSTLENAHHGYVWTLADPSTGSGYWAPSSGGGGSGGGCLRNLATFKTLVSNVDATETDLYSYTMPANTLANDGDRLEIHYTGFFASPTAANLLFYLGNVTNIITLPSNPVTSNQVFDVSITITRTAENHLSYSATMIGGVDGVMLATLDDVGLTGSFTTDDLVVKVTGVD